MDATKTGIRREALVRRRGLTQDELGASGRALATALVSRASGRVAAYASQPTEPGTGLLLEALDEVLLPILLPDGDLDWALYEGELVEGARGSLEPPGARLGRDAVADCGLVVVPALAVDRFGVRLGRGGGSYDRALARTTGWLVAALHPGEVVARIPVEPHDVPVHAAVVPGRGLLRMRPHPHDGVGLGPDGMQ